MGPFENKRYFKTSLIFWSDLEVAKIIFVYWKNRQKVRLGCYKAHKGPKKPYKMDKTMAKAQIGVVSVEHYENTFGELCFAWPKYPKKMQK